MGDRNFVVGVAEYARMLASIQSQPVYFYMFGYRGNYTLSDYLSGIKGTQLGEMLLLVYSVTIGRYLLTELTGDLLRNL